MTSTSLQSEYSLRRSQDEASANRIYWLDTKKKLSLAERDHLRLRVRYGELQNTIEQYRNEARQNPIQDYIDLCLYDMILEGHPSGKSCIESIDKLLSCDLISLKKENEQDRLVGDFNEREHLATIEVIRCKQWSLKEKRILIEFYIRLTREMSKYTKGAFPEAYDFEREECRNKVIDYWIFFEFVQHLSVRDSLIAKLLYFGAPGIEDVISLKLTGINCEEGIIQFEGECRRFPKHVVQDLRKYLESSNDRNGLAFLNVRGDSVERTHLVRSFIRASKAIGEAKITPSTLLEFK